MDELNFIFNNIKDYSLISSKSHKDYIFFRPHSRSQFMLINYHEYDIEITISPIVICFKQSKLFFKTNSNDIIHAWSYISSKDLTQDHLEFFKMNFL